MNLTHDTTDATILANVETARARVIGLCNERASATDIAEAALLVANAEGMASARIAYRNTLRNAADHLRHDPTHPEVVEAARTYLRDLILSGADDTWSGRGNDARRARHDGFLAGARELLMRR
ncbi:hypothetical protein [Nocardioides nanhaiensis]|uniref:Uncharacterized protein n=1 Tax=Nocardioides nanhaiensis TaxID=1476871 RepID=A0ABP8W4P1_9ACTN